MQRLRRDPKELVEAARGGDRAAVARLISLVEEGGESAREVGRATYPLSGRAYTVGVTGAPGAGKSTLTDRLISRARAESQEVGVLAVDPSSPFSGGALLGDRARMQEHATDPGVFIRSMATRGHLGGLSLATPEAIRVLDATGRPLVLVETVGAGQTEVEVAGAADTTMVVLNPGWGDALQASKAGLLEAADIFVINKADRAGVGETERDLEFMLHLSSSSDGWTPPIIRTVATRGDGTDQVWDALARHRAFLGEDGRLERRRARRLAQELREIVARRLELRARAVSAGPAFDRLLEAVVDRRLDPYQAAEEILASLDN